MVATALALLLAASGPRCAELVSINDLHGHVEALPGIGSRIAILRERRPVVLVDAGDSMQGTLESSLSGGRAIMAGYAALGVAATALGNHDLDYGQATLRERAAEASFPFLAANVRLSGTGRRLDWKNFAARRIVRLPNGLAIGLFGLAGEDTPWVTMPRNAAGLEFGSAAAEAVEQAAALRREGADLVVAVAHIGAHCERPPRDPRDLGRCDPKSALIALLSRLPRGTIDAIAGGHTHEVLRLWVNGVAAIQAGSRGEALGWVTLCEGERPVLHRPIRLSKPVFLGNRAVPDARVATAVAPFLQAAAAERERPVGVRLQAALTRDRRSPSGFGSAVAAGLREASGAEFAVVNAGSLRTDVPAGELRYGRLYEALPFEDHLVVLTMTGSEIESLLAALGGGGKGFPQTAGLRIVPGGVHACDGRHLDPERLYRVATNEFLAAGGDGVGEVVHRLPPERVAVRPEMKVRDAFLEWLRKAQPARLAAQCP